MAGIQETIIELGEYINGGNLTPGSSHAEKGLLRFIRFVITTWSRKLSTKSANKTLHDQSCRQIEDHPNGYPRYSALVASHDSFFLCRRFSTLRARLLLLKQDKLSILEQKLEAIDRNERNPLRLGSSRVDDNAERAAILSEIDSALADYDEFIARSHQILGFETARLRNVSNLRNWVDGNGCVAREETTYLKRSEDLVSIANPDDTVMSWLELLAEDGLIGLRRYFKKQRWFSVSRDSNVHILKKSYIARLARALMTPAIILLLLAPVVVCSWVSSISAQLGTVIISCTIFVAVLSGSTRAKAVELVVAGATYTTVLTVFVSSTNVSRN